MRLPILLLAVAILSVLTSSWIPPVRAVETIAVTLDRTSGNYLNGSLVVATVLFSGWTGSPFPPPPLDVDVSWYSPSGSWLAGGAMTLVQPDTSKKEAFGTASWVADRGGIGFQVNASWLSDPSNVFSVTAFNVYEPSQYAIVTEMSSTLNATIVEEADTVRASVQLTFQGNASLLGNVSFAWYRPGAAMPFRTVNASAVGGAANDSWVADLVGVGYTLRVTYWGEDLQQQQVTFEVRARRYWTAAQNVTAGTVTWSRTTGPGGGPYLVCGNLTVEEGATLLVQDGAIVRFCRGSRLLVNGTLRVGPGATTLLTSYEFVPAKGDWDGVWFNPSSGGSWLHDVRFEYFTNGLVVSGAAVEASDLAFDKGSSAAIDLRAASATTSWINVAINDTAAGLVATASAVNLTGVNITLGGDGLHFSGSSVRLQGVAVWDATGTALFLDNSPAEVSDLTVRSMGNYAIQVLNTLAANFTRLHQSLGVVGFRAMGSVWINISESQFEGASGDAIQATFAKGLRLVNTSVDGGAQSMRLTASDAYGLNVTLNLTRLAIAAGSTLLLENFLHVTVQDAAAAPLAGANVSAVVDGSAPRPAGSTDAAGHAYWIALPYRTYRGAAVTTHEVVVNVSKEGYVAQEVLVDMAVSHAESVTLLRANSPGNDGDGNPDGFIGQVVRNWPWVVLVLAALLLVSLALIPVLLRRRAPESAAGSDPTNPAKPVVVEPGGAYLINGENANAAYERFAERVKDGTPGLCITRHFPDDVRAKWGVRDAEVLWLSRGGTSETVSPTNLGGLVQTVEEFAKTRPYAVVLLDGLEYLIEQNNFGRVVRFLHRLRETAALRKAILFVPFQGKTLDEAKTAVLLRELTALD